MNVRMQMAMVFHLDKCIGCHTCSIACKNIWTDRKGAEYMWWNNVETKPGTGFPTLWEDQENYHGGWEVRKKKLRLKSTGKFRTAYNIYHNPSMPTMDDYYEPWTYEFDNLFSHPERADQPTARPVSVVNGELINIEAGPNWDDDLGGSPVYAESDPNLRSLPESARAQLFAIERLVFFYFPRICNHCFNPSCVASCPSGALYKRGEDGIVLLDQTRCRGWRACVPACPYKKVYYNWNTGKSEKCILCFPRLESGQAQACFHSCVGRIRYVGAILYDAERIEAVASMPDEQLVEGQRSLILDPSDPAVIEGAHRNGIDDSVLEAARKSPVYKFVKIWKIALPPHIEFRTLPMLFYVPPLSPVIARKDGETTTHVSDNLFHDIEDSRVPIQFLANLFGVGDEGRIRYVLRKVKAVCWYRRAVTVGDVTMAQALQMLQEADSSVEEAEAIYRLTALATFGDQFVIPPMHREEALRMLQDPLEHKGTAGLGFMGPPMRGL